MGGFNPINPTKYKGTDKYITFFVSRNRSPTSADFKQPETGRLYSIGTVWQVGKDPTTGVEGDLWMLSKIVANVAYWLMLTQNTGPILNIAVPLGVSPIEPDIGGTITFTSTGGTLAITGSSANPNNHFINFDLVGGTGAIDSVAVQSITAPGVTPVFPTALGLITVNGAVVANHSVVLETRSRALNAYNLEVQYATSAAATDGTKSGVAHFNSGQFSVDAVGFVSLSGTGSGQTITGDTGGPLSPTAGNWNVLGRSGSKTSGSGSTLTVNSPPFSQVAATSTSVLNSGEFVTAAVTRTLPATAGLLDGDLVIYYCTTASALIITANTGQTIRIGTLVSSSAGTATSTAIGDTVTLRFDATAVSWRCVSVIGTWLLA